MLNLFRRNSPRFFLTRNEASLLAERISVFEKKTSCELAFHFRRRLGDEPLKKNEELFYKFNLHQTRHRNAILISVATYEKKFAIWADQGVMRHTGDKLWIHVSDLMSHLFKNGKHLQGLIAAIDEAEPILEKEQPHFSDDVLANEISNFPIIEDKE